MCANQVRTPMNETAQRTRSSLLMRIRSPDNQAAWATFVDIYTPLVFGFARRRGLQEADAADVTQEVMRAVARSIGHFEYRPEQGGFRAWLFRVTRNKFNNLLERRRRQPLVGGGSTLVAMIEAVPCPEEDEHWDQDYRRHLFEWAAERMRPEVEEKTWRAFWQTAVEGQSAKEVAGQLGLTVGAVYIARSRVTARLRELVASVADDEPALVMEDRDFPPDVIVRANP